MKRQSYGRVKLSFHKLSSLGCSNLVEIQNTKVVLTRIIDIYEGIFIPSYHMKRTLLLDCLVVEISAYKRNISFNIYELPAHIKKFLRRCCTDHLEYPLSCHHCLGLSQRCEDPRAPDQ